MAKKTCVVCGGEFDGYGKAKYCPSCKETKCCVCGGTVKMNDHNLTMLKERGWVTCSVKCGNVMAQKARKANGTPNMKPKTVVCELCGKEFEGIGGAKYCDECHHVKCCICGKEMELHGPKMSKYVKQGYITCSQKCGAVVAKAHNIEKYGVDSPTKLPEARERSRQVRLNESEETKAKRSKTLREVLNTEEVKAKRGAARQRRIEETGYGSNMEDPEFHANMIALAKTPEARAKALETHAKNHNGAKTPFQQPEVIEKITNSRHEKRDETRKMIAEYVSEHPEATPRKICRELGLRYHSLLDYNRTFGLGINLSGGSSYEEAFRDCLIERGIDYEREYRMQVDGLNDRRNCPRYDFLIGDVLVEIDPWHYHNATFVDAWYEKELEPHEPSYHMKKSRYAMEHEGKFCIHVFDWDDYEMIADMFVKKEFVNVSDLRMVVSDKQDAELSAFFDENHLQGSCKGVKFAVMLVDDSGIVSAMTFGKPRYDSECEHELLRYCTRIGMAVRGGSEALLNAFAEANEGSVVSYCDNAKFSGRVYEKLGFENVTKKQRPHLHWYNPDTGQHFTAAYVNQLGVDKILGTSYGKGAKNDELMVKEGFVEIYDCGQSKWVLRS